MNPYNLKLVILLEVRIIAIYVHVLYQFIRDFTNSENYPIICILLSAIFVLFTVSEDCRI